MIVIKIKTWKDYKKQLLDWLKEPRQEVCEHFVFLMEQYAQTEVDERISEVCEANGISDEIKFQLVHSAQLGIIEARNSTRKIIKKYQPKGIFK